MAYDTFGKLTSETNPAVDSLFLFTGRPFDQNSQLQNNLNRWYDARVGRWLSEDPVGFAGGDGNLYRYVGNGPLQGGDALGLLPCTVTGEYYRIGQWEITPVPLEIVGPDVSTNPVGGSEVPLGKLGCKAELKVIAKYQCCCRGKTHMVYKDAFIALYSEVALVPADNVWVRTISVPVPIDIPFGPAVSIKLGFHSDQDKMRAHTICETYLGPYLGHLERKAGEARIWRSRVPCPFHED